MLSAGIAEAQLRIVTYNTTGAPSSGIDIVLKSIGEELRNGIAKPIDILLLQEQSRSTGLPDTQAFVTLLNTIYSGQGVTYARGTLVGGVSTSGDNTQTIVYRTQTIQLIGEGTVGTASTSGQPRQALRYQLRPAGYNSSADFYIYNSHYKASAAIDDPAAPSRRNTEATAIRANSNALGQGAHVIYAGDHNFYDFDADEPAWGTLVAAGNGQANDPINQVGTWHINSSFAAVHTQSPCTSSVGNCGVPGGMDDRFDFQLVTGEFLDGAGLSYVSGSYHAFGNNGTTYNNDINSASNTVSFPGVTSYTKSQILNALHAATDHIPVVADYQIPAVMQALAGTIPSSIDLGSSFNLNVTVNNSASAVAANGADVLHYSLTTSGSVTGSFLNQNDAALGGSNLHSVGFNTSSIGSKSGTITVTSTNQGIPVGTINIPVSFLVVLPGDYNSDAVVDARDYVVWRKYSGLTGGATYAKGDGNRDGNVTIADYTIWRSHFGQTASGSGTGAEFASAVPEPSSLALVAIGICLVGRRPTRLKSWTRQS